MTDKKEVIDYLRNRQKAVEIKSKSNGINLWVLLAAASAIAWIAFDLYPEKIAQKIDEIAWFLIIFQSTHFSFTFSASVNKDSAEIRYLSVGAGPYPVMQLISSAWRLIPPFFLLSVAGISFQSIAVGLFSMVIFLVVVVSVLRLVWPDGRKKKFPDPSFVAPSRVDIVISLLGCGVFLYCAISGLLQLGDSSDLDLGLVKFSCLISVLYLMIQFAIEKKIENGAIEWTYELEADLVLDLITVDVAARKIEHRYLGVRLAQVMDDFYSEMDKKIAKIEEETSSASARAGEILKIPDEYVAERKARWNEILDPSLSLIDSAIVEMRELVNYLEKLRMQPLNFRLKETVEIHSARGHEYADRLINMSSSLKEKTRELIPDPTEPDR